MAFISLPGITCWGNPYSRLLGAWGLSPSHGGGGRPLQSFTIRSRIRGRHLSENSALGDGVTSLIFDLLHEERKGKGVSS
jgi:hypothetical protein